MVSLSENSCGFFITFGLCIPLCGCFSLIQQFQIGLGTTHLRRYVDENKLPDKCAIEHGCKSNNIANEKITDFRIMHNFKNYFKKIFQMLKFLRWKQIYQMSEV